MNRDTAKKLAPTIKAYGDGKDVQLFNCFNQGRWTDTDNPSFNPEKEWRVKPEPRVFWINDYADGSIYIHKSQASAYSVQNINSKVEVIKVIEVLEDD